MGDPVDASAAVLGNSSIRWHAGFVLVLVAAEDASDVLFCTRRCPMLRITAGIRASPSWTGASEKGRRSCLGVTKQANEFLVSIGPRRAVRRRHHGLTCLKRPASVCPVVLPPPASSGPNDGPCSQPAGGKIMLHTLASSGLIIVELDGADGWEEESDYHSVQSRRIAVSYRWTAAESSSSEADA